MEGYQMHIECIYIEHRVCNSCNYCRQVEASNASLDDYEPSDAEIEAWIEKQMLDEELKSDNL